jgi:SAM-dependent methyltransferase
MAASVYAPQPDCVSGVRVRYEHQSLAWGAYEQKIVELIAVNRFRDILDVGGGANPSLPPDKISGLNYSVLDVSQTELDKTPKGYRTICANILEASGEFDLVVSKMFCEHVADGEALHRKIFQLLRPGGVAFHFFPTLYAPSMVINRLAPESLTSAVVSMLYSNRHRNGSDGKFPAYYSWCRGPSRRQIKRFESIGYEVEEYVGFFGTEYFRVVPPVQRVADVFSHFLVRHPFNCLTSDCFLTLRKGDRIPFPK